MVFSIDTNSIKRSAEFMRSVNEQLKGRSTENDSLEFVNFKARNHKNIIAAVDGSHHSIKGNSFVFSAINSGFQLYQERTLYHTEVSRTKIEVLTKDNYKNRHTEYYMNVTGQMPKGHLEFDKVTERIRTLLEWDKVSYLINILNEGDIILFDGSMISGVISTNKDFFEELCQRAKEKGITLAGLSKDTSLTEENVPVPMILSRQALNQGIKNIWYHYYQKENTYFVRFRKQYDLIFRLDLVVPEGVKEEEIIKLIGSYCFNEGTQGYPYPLQWIHDEVRISRQQFEHCIEIFKNECAQMGVSKQFIDELFTIYHDQLDVISNGR